MIHESTRRNTKPPPKPAEPLTATKIDFAYSIFWTKMTRTWDSERRKLMAGRVNAVIQSPDFHSNALERKFTVEGLDDTAHSGASLLALQKVLATWEKMGRQI